jgi:signal transduction histidine kinase
MSATVATALVVAYFLLGYPAGAPMAACIVAFYSLGAYGGGRRAVLVGAVLVAAATVAPSLPPRPVWPTVSATTLLVLFMFLATALAGDAVRLRRAATAERIARAEAARDEAARHAVTEERLRIAREVHDVIGHTIAAITVQAGLAADALADDPAQTRASLAAIRAAANGAIAELGETIGMLRSDTVDDHLAGPPGLARLPWLAEAARAAGLRVELDVCHGTAHAAVELAAYRIVQEALTNVVRHAHAETATVTLRTDGQDLVVRVLDDGRAHVSDSYRPGRGLTGMAERARALAGSLHAGPAPAGGFQVLARLPLTGAAE